MTESAPVYYADLTPTPEELMILARLRQLSCGVMMIERNGDMLRWAIGRKWEMPSNGNGKHLRTIEEQIIEARNT